MRSYIFTDKERALLWSFFQGTIGLKDRSLHVILSRVRHFQALSSDVDLYLRIREAITTTST
jgi:hypothetical protein